MSSRAHGDAQLTRQLRVLHADSRGTYGRPRLHRALQHRGVVVGAKRVARLMRAAGLVARGRRRFRVTTTPPPVSAPIAPHRLQRQFHPAALNTTWAGDITAVWTQAGWAYLAIVMDLASRRIVGWTLDRRLDSGLVTAALEHACRRRPWGRPALFHSDQGTQYASQAFTHRLAQHAITASMSRRGNCWDNAPVESFFSTLKAEAWPTRPWTDVHEARRAVGDYIDHFYNSRRLHSTLGYRSPEAYERQRLAAV